MKQVLFFLSCCLLALSAQAQNKPEDIIRSFSHEAKVECVKISPLLLSFARLCIDDEEERALLSQCKSFQMLSLEACSDNTKERFRESVAKMEDDQMELLAEISEDEDDLRILVHRKGNAYDRLVMVNTGQDPFLMHASGRIVEEVIQNLIQDSNNDSGSI